MSGADIAAVVVSRDSEETLDACLSRLRAADGVAEIRVVDCNSGDTSMAIVQRHAVADARLRFIANPDHPGLGAARNQGVAACAAPWIALLDPGCLPERDALRRLRALAAEGDRLVGADLVDEAGLRMPSARLQTAPPGGGADWWRWLGYAAVAMSAAPTQAVEAVAGALLVLSRARFEALGGFDPAYRTGVADLDLCRRARAAGARIVCANALQVTRVRGVAERAHPLHLAWHRRVDASRYGWRNVPRGDALVALARIWSRYPLDLSRVLVRAGADFRPG